MKTKKTIISLLVLAIPLLLGALACNLSNLYQIENPRMALCKKDEQVCSLSGASSISPSSNQNICIVWTEVNRPSSEDLVIYIYDENRNEVFSYTDKIEEDGASEARECKFFVVDQPLLTGKYTTEFSSSGQISATIEWRLRKNYSPIK